MSAKKINVEPMMTFNATTVPHYVKH